MLIRNLGTLNANITADTKQLTKDLKQGDKQFKGFSENTTKRLKTVGIAMAGVGVAVTGALTKLIFDAGKAGDAFDKMSLRTGESVEALSGLKFAAEISGSTMGDVEIGLRRLAANMLDFSQGTGEAKKSFESLGISVLDQNGQLRSSVDVMLDVSDGLNTLSSESEKTAIAQDLFGRSGQKLLPLFKEGSEGINTLTDRARELGLVMSTEAATASAEFEDRLTELTGSVKMAGFELAQVLLPTITSLIEKLTDLTGWFSRLTDNQQKMIGWGTAITGAFSVIAGGMLLVLPKIPLMITGLTSLLALAPALPITAGIIALGAAITIGVLEIRKFNKELDLMTARKIHGLALKEQAEAMRELVEAVQGANKNFMASEVALTNAARGTERLAAITKILGDDIVVADGAIAKIKVALGSSDGYISVTDAAEKVTKALAGITDTATTNTSVFKSVVEAIFNPVAAFSTLMKNLTGEMIGFNQASFAFLDAGKLMLPTIQERAAALKAENDALRAQGIALREPLDLLKLTKEEKKAMAKLEMDIALDKDRQAERDEEIRQQEISGLHIEQRALEMGIEADEDAARAKEQTQQIRQKVVDDYENLMKRRVTIDEKSWLEISNVTARGVNALNNSYLSIVDMWRTLTGDQREFHDTWLSDMTLWVTNIASLLNDLTTVWKSAVTIINKVASFLPGGGGGGATDLAGALGGGGGGIGTLGKIGGTASGIGAVLGKIGGGIKAGAGAAAGGIASAAGAAAPIALALAPFLAFGAAAFGLSKLNDIPTLGHVFGPGTPNLSLAGTGNTVSDELRRIRNEQFRQTAPFLSTRNTLPSLLGRGGPEDILSREFGLARQGGQAGGAAGVERIVSVLNQILQALQSDQMSPVSQRQIGSALWELVGPSARAGGFV